MSERGKPPVPLRAGHVCLLFKRFVSFGSDVTRPYVAALEARRVPHVLVGGRSWHAREEVAALVTALSAIEWPDDDLSVFAALRVPYEPVRWVRDAATDPDAELGKPARIAELIHELFVHYTPGVLPPTDEELTGGAAATA